MAWLLWLASVLWVAPLFWWCCCARCGDGCTTCNPRHDGDMQVVIAGYAAAPPTGLDCPFCTRYNGTFILQNDCCKTPICDVDVGDCCRWDYDITGAGCPVTLGVVATAAVRFRVFLSGSNYITRVTPISWQADGSGSTPFCYEHPYYDHDHGTSKPDCRSFVAVSHVASVSSSMCDISAVTIEVTSL